MYEHWIVEEVDGPQVEERQEWLGMIVYPVRKSLEDHAPY